MVPGNLDPDSFFLVVKTTQSDSSTITILKSINEGFNWRINVNKHFWYSVPYFALNSYWPYPFLPSPPPPPKTKKRFLNLSNPSLPLLFMSNPPQNFRELDTDSRKSVSKFSHFISFFSVKFIQWRGIFTSK